jgi:PAS domain S-box-containing protein
MVKIARKSEGQKAAEVEVKDFKDNLGPFVVAAETTRMAMVFTDAKQPKNPIIFANDAFLSLTGYPREEVLGQGFNFLLAHAADAEALALIKAEYEVGSNAGSEVLYRRKDGTEFWAVIMINPVRDEKDEIVQHFASFVDLTKHKDEQVQSRMLIDELNHRVKNTLATVQSIVWQALRSASDPKVIRETIESRLLALSRSHDLLTREHWKSAGLHDVISGALQPFGVAGSNANRIVLRGDDIRFPPKAALALGIAFNELATNAAKYGALSNAAGSILVDWKTVTAPEGKRIVLQWREIDGPPVSPPVQRGFGSTMIERGLALELDGKIDLDYRPDGVVCTMNFPVPQGDDNE